MGLKILSRLFSRRESRQNLATADRCLVEPLEKRELMALNVTSIIADNRGSVQATLGADADPLTVHRTSVQVYTTGPDGKIYTADDVFVPSAVRYYSNIRRISINFTLPANTQYRVKLVSSRIKDLLGNMLDGEFNGSLPTGNGVPGGNTEFTVVHDKSATPLVRMSTSKGVITLKVFRGLKPRTAAHFLSKVNSGDYDNIFFTRKVTDFIIQAGSLKIDQTNTVVQPNSGPTLVNEFTPNPLSNLQGTLSFARLGGQPNSASNQFFINSRNNPGLDTVDGVGNGFTVFAQVANQASLDVVEAINDMEDVALHNGLTGDGVLPNFPGTGLTNVPVNDVNKYDGFGFDDIVSNNPFEINYVVTGNFSANTDTVVVGRTAMLFKLQKLTS